MRRSRVLLCTLLALLTVSLALPGAAGAVGFVDRQVQMGILLLRGYIDTQAAKKGFVYPEVSEVRKGGGLSAPIWPGNPWTGKTMQPGKSRGTYTYKVNAARSAYTLTGHLSTGAYKVTGGLPAFLRSERDAGTRVGVALLQQYVEIWARTHGGAYPQAADVTPGGGVGLQPGSLLWPQNPWTRTVMTAGAGVGDYTYQLTAGGYELRGHLSTGTDWVRSGGS